MLMLGKRFQSATSDWWFVDIRLKYWELVKSDEGEFKFDKLAEKTNEQFYLKRLFNLIASISAVI